MMFEYLELGQAPAGEDCAQVGSPDYRQQAKLECQHYIEALRRVLGKEPFGARLGIKAFEHDFGLYYEAVCYYDPTKPEAVNYAYDCESKAPMTWQEAGMEPPRERGLER